MAILVTGAAGFIGFHLARHLLAQKHEVVGIDNLNAYYDPALKHARLKLLLSDPGFRFFQMDISDQKNLDQVFEGTAIESVAHMAAQAGVRYSLSNPQAYVQSNLAGFACILESCRHHQVKHLVFASSSSVYGANTKQPFCEDDPVDHPVSLYAATKKSNELMAHSYAHLYGLPVTGLRFFTVYGPWGRPDMAPFLFTKAIFEGLPIKVYNYGQMKRDFTYVDDIVEGVARVLARVPQPDPQWPQCPKASTSSAPYRLYNIGNNHPVLLMEFIKTLENAIGKKARMEMLPMQAGDMLSTSADIEALKRDTGFAPRTSLAQGLARLVAWYRDFYGV